MQIVMLGPPGAGKGTQSRLLSAHLRVPHLSVGALLRDQIARETPLGVSARPYVEVGELVPQELMVGMLEETIAALSGGFILDGYPRSVEQALALTELLERLHRRLTAVLGLVVPTQVTMERLLARGREDDTREIVLHRIEVYEEETELLLDLYGGAGVLRLVDGVGSVEEVHQRMVESLRDLSEATPEGTVTEKGRPS